MIVLLDDSIGVLDAGDAQKIAGLEAILCSSFNGDHLVTGSFNILNAMLRLNLGPKSIAVLKRAQDKVAYFGGLIGPTSFVLNIVKTGQTVRISERKWQAPLDKFSNQTVPKSIVLGENKLDAEAYIFAAWHARAKLKLKGQFRLIPGAGGGSQIPVVLELYITHENGFCFCITDGDYSYPQEAASAVTKQCIDFSRVSAWPTVAQDIPGRSIENWLF
jgi:hypothetical protein